MTLFPDEVYSYDADVVKEILNKEIIANKINFIEAWLKNKLNKKNIFFEKLFVIKNFSNLNRKKYLSISLKQQNFVTKKLQFGDVFVT